MDFIDSIRVVIRYGLVFCFASHPSPDHLYSGKTKESDRAKVVANEHQNIHM